MVDAITAFAPAKINLTLHVTGRTPDGYHLLDSLAGFAAIGDRISLSPARDWSLEVNGPMSAGVPTDETNIVLKAARLIGGPPAVIRLEKNLPHAAGLGGGSADAAALLRVLAAREGRAVPASHLDLGADIPACLASHPLRLRGIGERIDAIPRIPLTYACLVNPRIPVPTGQVFSALTRRDNAPMPETLPEWPDAASFADWLGNCRNDLEDPARSIAPAIGVALARIGATDGCLLSRMSGSGATCFGMYGTAPEADAAASAIRERHPDWWIASTALLTDPPEIS